MKNLIVLSLIITFSIISVYSQVHSAFIDDTQYVFQKIGTVRFNEYAYSLKDSLPDGKWILFNLNRSDSSMRSEKNIIMVSYYENNVRNGMTYIYERDLKDETILTSTINFSNGVMDGVLWRLLGSSSELITFSNGKKNGLRIVQVKYQERKREYYLIQTIELYKGDTLMQWTDYDKSGSIYRSGNGNLLINSCQINFYNQGVITSTYFFTNQKLDRCSLYNENGILCKDYFYDSDNGNKRLEKLNLGTLLITSEKMFYVKEITPYCGSVFEYNNSGQLIKGLYYLDGDIIKVVQ